VKLSSLMYSRYGNDLSMFIIHFMYICSHLHRKKGPTGAGRRRGDSVKLILYIYRRKGPARADRRGKTV